MPHPNIPGLFIPAPKSRRRGMGAARKPKQIRKDDHPLAVEIRKELKYIQVRVLVESLIKNYFQITSVKKTT